MMKHFEINGSEPAGEGKWRANIVCHVVAETAQRAMQLAIEKHPTMEVWSLNHRGRVDIIEDVTLNV